MQRYGIDPRSHRDPDPRAAGLTIVLTVDAEIEFTVRIPASPATGIPLAADARSAAEAVAGFLHARAGIPAHGVTGENRGYDAGYLTGAESIYRGDLELRALELKGAAEQEAE